MNSEYQTPHPDPHATFVCWGLVLGAWFVLWFVVRSVSLLTISWVGLQSVVARHILVKLTYFIIIEPWHEISNNVAF